MKKLLVVDDHEHIRTLIRMALRDHFEVDEAANAASALAKIEQAPPAGIVLDVMMPGEMDGFALCQRIKSDERLAGIHVVMLTARTQIADQEHGYAIGADAYFLKPFSPLALALHLDTVFNTEAASGHVSSSEASTHA